MPRRPRNPRAQRRLGLPLAAVVLMATAALALSAPEDDRPDAGSLSVVGASGTLEHDNSLDGSSILSASQVWPGWTGSGDVTITNTGTAGSWLRLTEAAVDNLPGPGGGQLSNRLSLVIEDVTDPGLPRAGLHAAARRGRRALARPARAGRRPHLSLPHLDAPRRRRQRLPVVRGQRAIRVGGQRHRSQRHARRPAGRSARGPARRSAGRSARGPPWSRRRRPARWRSRRSIRPWRSRRSSCRRTRPSSSSATASSTSSWPCRPRSARCDRRSLKVLASCSRRCTATDQGRLGVTSKASKGFRMKGKSPLAGGRRQDPRPTSDQPPRDATDSARAHEAAALCAATSGSSRGTAAAGSPGPPSESGSCR